MKTDTPTIAVFTNTRGGGCCRSCLSVIAWFDVVATGKRMPFLGGRPTPVEETRRNGRRIAHMPRALVHWPSECRATTPRATR